MVAVPFFYNDRMNGRVFTGGMLAFVGIPFIAGVLQKQPHRSVVVVAIVLLLFCPVVYAITDPLAVEFEKLRDGYFLTIGSTLIFVSATWLVSSFKLRRLAHAVTAALGLLSAAVGVLVLLWMIMYFE